MPRSINRVASKFRKKKIFNISKGYYGSRSNVFSIAKNAVEKALQYAYIGRKKKKTYYRSIWIQRINAVLRNYHISYSNFINKLYMNKIYINRKILTELAVYHPNFFKLIIDKIK